MQETLKTGLLSVVLPAYNEESSIPRAAEVICGLLTQADIRHELIFCQRRLPGRHLAGPAPAGLRARGGPPLRL